MNEDIKEKVRNEYDRFMTGLKESIMNIERIKGENSEFDKIQKSFIDTIQKQYSIVLYITIEKYTIFQLKSIPVLIVCEDKKSYLNAG